MLPNLAQFKKWTLINKWTYLAAVIGTITAIAGIIINIVEYTKTNKDDLDRNRLVLRVAQEMRYNSVLLREIAQAFEEGIAFPSGSLKTDGLMTLINTEYDGVTEHSYGEEKYIYQETIKLRDLGDEIKLIRTNGELISFNKRSTYTMHDIIFLNDFLRWYLQPIFEKELTAAQIYSLGWNPFPDDKFYIPGVKTYSMKKFIHDGEPIKEFSLYLGLID